METAFILVLFACSSAIGIGLGRFALGLPPRALKPATEEMLRFVGAWALCIAANLALGGAFILTTRRVAGIFLSTYLLNDVSVVLVSALQGSILHHWLAARNR